MAEVSQAARDVCARWFSMGQGSEVKSHPPHATLDKVRPAMNELVNAGIVTERPFNQFGVMVYTGSPEASRIGRERVAEIAKDNGWA